MDVSYTVKLENYISTEIKNKKRNTNLCIKIIV